jgi:hypothetical protein
MSKIKHFKECQVVYPSDVHCIPYYAYEYMYKQREHSIIRGRVIRLRQKWSEDNVFTHDKGQVAENLRRAFEFYLIWFKENKFIYLILFL